ncbi:electrogenic aspartate/glutamate antiporter SLC25A12, mitochondrial-like isoform X3 [Dysidea avara]|uniref:electrogenic aspartate/glutamate antiporter SLC25A12, mitochondrial-like isoform X3 n=1 Tax=Dysidea avara TaxID=196820 RepID=UPI003324A9CC
MKLLEPNYCFAVGGIGGARIRSSPQFVVTLMTYELLQRVFQVDFGKSKPPSRKRSDVDLLPQRDPDMIGGFRVAHHCLAGMESRYGLVFPKNSPSPVTTNPQNS